MTHWNRSVFICVKFLCFWKWSRVQSHKSASVSETRQNENTAWDCVKHFNSLELDYFSNSFIFFLKTDRVLKLNTITKYPVHKSIFYVWGHFLIVRILFQSFQSVVKMLKFSYWSVTLFATALYYQSASFSPVFISKWKKTWQLCHWKESVCNSLFCQYVGQIHCL